MIPKAKKAELNQSTMLSGAGYTGYEGGESSARSTYSRRRNRDEETTQSSRPTNRGAVQSVARNALAPTSLTALWAAFPVTSEIASPTVNMWLYEAEAEADAVEYAEKGRMFQERAAERPDFEGLEASPKVAAQNIPDTEKRRQSLAAIDMAAKATGLSSTVIGGIAVKESGLRWDAVSPTGCAGLGQFSKGTAAGVMKQHGDEMISSLKAAGATESAARLEQAVSALDRNYAGNKYSSVVQNARYDVNINALMTAHYLKDLGASKGYDSNELATDSRKLAHVYAMYNIGPKNADNLFLRGITGSKEAALNPLYNMKNGHAVTAGQAVQNYVNAIVGGEKSYLAYAGKVGTVPALAATTDVPAAAPKAETPAPTLAASFNPKSEATKPAPAVDQPHPTDGKTVLANLFSAAKARISTALDDVGTKAPDVAANSPVIAAPKLEKLEPSV